VGGNLIQDIWIISPIISTFTGNYSHGQVLSINSLEISLQRLSSLVSFAGEMKMTTTKCGYDIAGIGQITQGYAVEAVSLQFR
jgi:hypothetical protein